MRGGELLLLVEDEVEALSSVEVEAGVAGDERHAKRHGVVGAQVNIDAGVEQVSHNSSIGSFTQTSP